MTSLTVLKAAMGVLCIVSFITDNSMLIRMDKIADLDIKRIQSLTDGIFAVVSTILILELKIPQGLDHDTLVRFIFSDIIFKLLIFAMSFIILGAFWIDSHF